MERLSTHQFMILSSAVLLGTTFNTVGGLVIGRAGRDGWMAIFPSFILAIPFGLMIFSMFAKYPDKNLIEISEKVLGKWLAKGLGILYIFVVTSFGGVLSGQGIDMFTRTILPYMPRNVFILGGFLLVFYLFYCGVEVFARFTEVIFPIIVMALILIALFSIPHFEQGELYPILEEGIKPVLYGSLNITPWPMEYILFLAALLPFLPKKVEDLKQMKKGMWRSIFIVAFLDTIVILIEVLVFGPYEAVRLTYGFLALGKMIEVSRTISGVESIFTLIWMGALTIKVTAFFFAGMWAIRSVFGLRKFKWSFALGLIYIIIPMFVIRGTNIVVGIADVDRYILLPFAVCWVLLIWGVDKWKSFSKGL